jgi:hypothetical protein
MTAGTSSIENCYASGAVNAITLTASSAYAGGITGFTQRASFTNCYAVGDISGSGNGNVFSGGMIGGVSDSLPSSTISNCYATGRVNAVSGSTHAVFAGGITGRINTIYGSVAASGALNLSVSAAGGGVTNTQRIAGNNLGTLTNNIAYSGMTLTGGTVTDATANGVDGAGKTKAELLTHSTWETLFGAGFSANWKWLSGYPYPVLQWQNAAPAWTALP